MDTEEIRLERSPTNPRQEILIGINREIAVDRRIAAAVHASRRLFPYVVEQLAQNRLPGYTSPRDITAAELHAHMRDVRDELCAALDDLDATQPQEQV